jgi:CubicO group peptidase (beta-lactamase class C family)
VNPAALDHVLATALAHGDVPNVIGIAADRDGPVYEGAFGPRTAGAPEHGEPDPVTADTTFRIASMTKVVAAVAALREVESGLVELDAPVDTYLPEFADLGVLVGFDGDTPKLRPAARRATVRQLMTHTAGFGYSFFNPDLARWQTVTDTPHGASGSRRIFEAPLTSDPGTRFEYGIGTDWLGRVVEAVSGLGLDQYLDAHVFGPLGMHRTTFWPTPDQRAGAVPVHVRGEQGHWVAIDFDGPGPPEYPSAGAGLFSTPRDFLAFQRMLLGDGVLGEVRILDEATVAAMFRNQIGALDFPATIGSLDPAVLSDLKLGPDLKWGLGVLLNTARRPGLRATGSGGWSGVQNTHFWVDRSSGLTGAIYTQTLPMLEPGALRAYTEFERALYATS